MRTDLAEAARGASIARGLGRSESIRWPLKRADSLFELKYGKALVGSARRPGTVPVFGTNGQTGNHDTPLFHGPGVVLGRKGMGHLGVEWVDDDYWVIDTAYALAPIVADVDLKFAYYLIRHIGLDHLKHGTSNPSLTRDAFGSQLFPVPPLRDQRAIAELLGALDDKIDANDRVVQIGLALADALYARWRIELQPSAQVTFADLADIFGGTTPKTGVAEYWDGDHAWAVPRDVTGLKAPYLFDTERHISDSGLKSIGDRLHPAGSIFMTSRATIGAFAVPQPCVSR